jgi:hypothetical protein
LLFLFLRLRNSREHAHQNNRQHQSFFNFHYSPQFEV